MNSQSTYDMTGNASTNQLVVATFDNRAQADAAVSDLRAAGFSTDQIGIVARNQGDWSDFGGTNSNGNSNRTSNQIDDDSSAAATGAATGAAAGAGIGGLWAMGIAAGMLPAIGPVVAGGLLASLLASAAAGAATGGIAGGLLGMGMNQDEATYYENEVTSGRILVTVRAGARGTEAENILRQNGGYNMQNQRTSSFA